MSHKYQLSQWFYTTFKVALHRSLKQQKPRQGVLYATSAILVLMATITELPASKLLAQVPSQNLEAASFYQQGVMRYYRKDLQAAEYAFRKSLQQDPNLGTARNYLGNIMLQQNRLDVAAQEYTEAIRINPNYGEAYYNLGLTLHKQGQTDAAITVYRQALVIDPTLASAQYNLGLALYERGQKNEAIAAYQQAINLDPGNANAYINLAIALQDQGRNTEAIAADRRALQLNPSNAVAYNNIANLLAIQGQTSQAIATYIEAIRHIPNNTVAYYNLGVTLYNQGDFKKAKVVLKQARNQYREQGNIEQAVMAEQLVQEIALMEKRPETQLGQTSTLLPTQTSTSNVVQPVQQPNQPATPAQTQGNPNDVPVSVDQAPPTTVPQMPSLPETPLETPVKNPGNVPVSGKS